MAISLPDARQLSDEVLQSLRLRALRGCELGYSEIEVAELLGLSRETVSRWWTAYVDHGLEALPGDRTGRPVGSGRTLNDGQAARLRTILNEKSPEEVGIASPLWTRRAVAELIRKEYGIDMPVRTVGEYLERWGCRVRASSPSDAHHGRSWVLSTSDRSTPWQSLPHALAQLGRCRYLAQQREQRIHLDQLADCHHLPLHVVEQLLVGNLLRLTCLVRRQVARTTCSALYISRQNDI